MRVYRNAAGDAVLLVYRRVSTLYLTFTYMRSGHRVELITFSELLDAIPVRSVILPGPLPPLHRSLDETIGVWCDCALKSLRSG